MRDMLLLLCNDSNTVSDILFGYHGISSHVKIFDVHVKIHVTFCRPWNEIEYHK